MEKEKKILIVDDEEDFSFLVKKILNDSGYKTETAADGEEGLDKILKGKYDLILLDVNMPKLSGWQVCEKIKKDEQLKRIPVIMLTVRASEDDQMKGFGYEADDYLTKPIDPKILVARVTALLR